MDNPTIKPFDAKEVHSVKELCIRSFFDKNPFQAFNIKTIILIPPGQELDAMVIVTMLVGALNIWCHSESFKSQPNIKAMADKLLPLVKQMLKDVNMVNPETEIKNLINQLDANNFNNPPGEHRDTPGPIPNPELPPKP